MLNRLPNEPSAADRERRAAELIGRARELIPLIDRASDRIEARAAPSRQTCSMRCTTRGCSGC